MMSELAQVDAHMKKHAPGVEFIRRGGTLPSRVPIASPHGAIIREATELAQGVTPLEYPCVGGSLPDYVFTKILGVPLWCPMPMPTRPTMRRTRT
jgi:hypothetical protein